MNKDFIKEAYNKITLDLSRNDQTIILTNRSTIDLVREYTIGLPMNVAKYGVWTRIDDYTIYSPSLSQFYTFMNITQSYPAKANTVLVLDNDMLHDYKEYMGE